ncbi:hypothetical protein MRT09_25385, partial [Escherichia coli]|nr:hypothetical protein [Escherichia coli]
AGSAHITSRKTVRMCSIRRRIHFRFLAHSLANARSLGLRRAEQLRKNDNAVMDSGVLSAVVTGYGEAPMPGNGEMTCYLLL